MSDQRWTVMRLIDWTKDHFAKAGLENPRLEAEVLLCHVVGMTRVELYTKYATIPGAESLARFKALIRRRIAGEPTQHLTNKAEFYGVPLYVDDRVLIPRPESERLVDVALETIDRETETTIADLCTGSGCIAVALARSLPAARILAIDISVDALEVARRNVEDIGLADRITLTEGDLTAPLRDAGRAGTLDMIVANPPYVRSDEVETLAVEIRDHEPRAALVAGPEGTEFHRRIAGGAPEMLRDGGALIMEIGEDQGPAVTGMMKMAGFREVKLTKDLSSRDRVASGLVASGVTIEGAPNG